MLRFSCEYRGAVNGRAVLVDCFGSNFVEVAVEVAAELHVMLPHGA
jgi:hypothetical protein